MSLLTFWIFFSAISFLFFGTACLFSAKMNTEFIRYGLPNSRKMVGYLQWMGGLGLLLGYYFMQWLQVAAALGLCILMLLGFLVRLQLRDSFFQSLPSLMYAFLNGYIFISLI